jgi:glycosyltransferase involved in cell wall biosynthesis
MSPAPPHEPSATGALIVTGMHHSGAPLLVSLLRAAGLDLGDSPREAESADPSGGCADREFLALERKMLLSCTKAESGWRDWGWTESQQLDFSRLGGFKPAAEALVRRRRSAARTWGWHDPRTALLLDFWDEILPDARYVFVYRETWAVAAAVAALGLDPFVEHPDFVPRIWSFYNRQLLDFYRRHRGRCLLVELASLLARPDEVLAHLQRKLALDLAQPSEDAAAALFGAPGQDPAGLDGATASLRRLSARLYPHEAQLWAELQGTADLAEGIQSASQPVAGARAVSQEEPTCSVVIPCFNDGAFLLDAVASVEAAGDVTLELVIVNDGSIDPFTLEVLERLRAAGYRVLDQPNRGLSSARNAGIRVSRGRYLLPLDADNRIRPSYPRRAAEVLAAAADVGVVYGDAALFGERSGVWRAPDFNPDDMVTGNRIDACAVVRRKAWERCGGYDESLKAGFEDWDFWLSIAEAGWRFVHLPEVLFDYRVRSGSMSSGLSKLRTRRRLLETIVAKHPAIFQPRLPRMFAEKDAHWRQADERASALERGLDEVRGSLETTRSELQAARDDLQSAHAELQAARAEPANLLRDLQAARGELHEARNAVQATRGELVRWQERVAFMTGTRAWRLRSGVLRLRTALGLRRPAGTRRAGARSRGRAPADEGE